MACSVSKNPVLAGDSLANDACFLVDKHCRSGGEGPRLRQSLGGERSDLGSGRAQLGRQRRHESGGLTRRRNRETDSIVGEKTESGENNEKRENSRSARTEHVGACA